MQTQKTPQQAYYDKIFRNCLLVFFALFVIGSVINYIDTPHFNPRKLPPSLPCKAELLNVRLIDTTTAQGEPTKMVLADWKNTGDNPIGSVYAIINIYDSLGNELESGSNGLDYTIFTAETNSEKILPCKLHEFPLLGFLTFNRTTMELKQIEDSYLEQIKYSKMSVKEYTFCMKLAI